jgi:hypothetical protein
MQEYKEKLDAVVSFLRDPVYMKDSEVKYMCTFLPKQKIMIRVNALTNK